MKEVKIVFFTGGGELPNIVYHHILKNYNLIGVVLDTPTSKTKMLKRRIKRLGALKVLSQIVFMKLITPLLRWESNARRNELLEPYGEVLFDELDNVFVPESINDPRVIDHVNNLKADLIVVCGTRLIHKAILNGITAPIINMHVGVTPKYRGVHGGYWALVNNDLEHCGVTVHLVDPGIDTGGVICQRVIQPTKKDNYATYPILQAIEGTKCVQNAVEQLVKGKLTVLENNLPSKLYYHPTIWAYLYFRLFKGVK